MVNQSVIDSSVDLEQLKDIEDLIPDMDKAISDFVLIRIVVNNRQRAKLFLYQELSVAFLSRSE